MARPDARDRITPRPELSTPAAPCPMEGTGSDLDASAPARCDLHEGKLGTTST